MEDIYKQIPIFRDWPLHGEGDAGLIPAQVAEYGQEHSAHWSNESRIPKHKEPLAFGDVDHSFSTDISRAKKVDSWKQVCCVRAHAPRCINLEPCMYICFVHARTDMDIQVRVHEKAHAFLSASTNSDVIFETCAQS